MPLLRALARQAPLDLLMGLLVADGCVVVTCAWCFQFIWLIAFQRDEHPALGPRPPLPPAEPQALSPEPWRRSGGSTEILELFEAATAALDQRKAGEAAAAASAAGGGGTDEVACRVQFRLAHYADQLYRAADAHLQSPEWATRLAVVAHKREQVPGRLYCTTST